MNFKAEYTLPEHMENDRGLPRSREERLLWVKRKVEDGYYDSAQIMKAVADAFIEPQRGQARWRQNRYSRYGLAGRVGRSR